MTKRNKILLGAGAGIALLAGTVAFAVDGLRPDRNLAEFDLNDDGQIAIAEANRVAQQRFTAFDVDQNGSLTGAELRLMGAGRGGSGSRGARFAPPQVQPAGETPRAAAPATAPAPQWPLPNDFNGDGAISVQEFSRGMATRFMLMDTNGNGVVSSAELDAAPRRGPGHGGRRH